MEELRPVSFDELKREYKLPDDTKMIGYAVYLPDSDEFLAKVKQSGLGVQRLYAKTPELAKTWPNVKRAIREAQAIRHKYRHVSVALVCDVGEQIVILEVLTYGAGEGDN